VTTPVKSIAKNTLRGPLMLFDPNGFDAMSPSTDMIDPAKGDGQNSKQRMESLFIF
jgi:hypothetical protein